jgi:hypothetical protein
MNDNIAEIGRPILASWAFHRLQRVSFLGILSPRYRGLPGHPLQHTRVLSDDGNRAQHSIGVAYLLHRLMVSFKYRNSTIAYGVAWALSHDISTWPLSHTGEAAFKHLISSSKLREKQIRGDSSLPRKFHIARQLSEMGVEGEVLLQLFNKKERPFDRDLAELWELLHSPVTPDTLEGMHRAAEVRSVRIPDPKLMVDSLYLDQTRSMRIRKSKSDLFFQFWRAKEKIYGGWINSAATVRFESAWSLAIRDSHQGIDTPHALDLQEEEMVQSAMHRFPHLREASQIDSPDSDNELRYKPPLKYEIERNFRSRVRLPEDAKVKDLSSIFQKEKK